MGYRVTFNNSNRDFFNTLKAEVDAYFEKNGIKKLETGAFTSKQLFYCLLQWGFTCF